MAHLQEFHFLWTAPIEAATLLILLGTLVHIWILPAVALILVILVSQYFFGYQIAKTKYKSMAYTKQRYVREPSHCL